MRLDMGYIILLFETMSNEIFICTRRTPLNMSFQKMTAEEGKVVVLANLKGELGKFLECKVEFMF